MAAMLFARSAIASTAPFRPPVTGRPEPATASARRIDQYEYYGQTSDPRTEFTVHQSGQRDNVGFMVWTDFEDRSSRT